MFDPNNTKCELNDVADESTQSAQVSITTAIKPTMFSKGYSLGANGDLLKLPGGNLLQGKVETRTVASLADLATLPQSLTPAQALVYGVLINAASRVITRKAFADAGKPKMACARSWTAQTFRASCMCSPARTREGTA